MNYLEINENRDYIVTIKRKGIIKDQINLENIEKDIHATFNNFSNSYAEIRNKLCDYKRRVLCTKNQLKKLKNSLRNELLLQIQNVLENFEKEIFIIDCAVDCIKHCYCFNFTDNLSDRLKKKIENIETIKNYIGKMIEIESCFCNAILKEIWLLHQDCSKN